MSGWASAITAAIGQMTPAQQVLYSGTTSRSSTKKRRKKKAKTSKRRKSTRGKKKAARAGGKRAYMVKGSPAAKRRMAQLRRLRKRKSAK